jgi:hypothetical protein
MTRRPHPRQTTPIGPRRPRLGPLTPAAEERVATMMAKLRGEKRATMADRMAAAKWLLKAGFGPAPDGDPAQFADAEGEEER